MTTAFNGADAMVRMLQLNGVKHIFGLCGDTSLPFYDAMARLDHGMDHILTRDERSAGYMADAYARVTGKVLDAEDQRRLIDEAIAELDFSALSNDRRN